MQSQFHNLPTFVDGSSDRAADRLMAAGASARRDSSFILQHEGTEYCAHDVTWNADPSDDEVCISMELSGAYADERVRSLKRTVSMIYGKCLILEDQYDTDLIPVLSLMTYEVPEISKTPDCINISIGDLGNIKVAGGLGANIQTLAITDPRLMKTWKHDCYRILITMKESGGHLVFAPNGH